MKTAILIILIAVSVKACAQQHAPTASQCQADLNLWRSQLEEYNNAEVLRMNNGTPNSSIVMKLRFTEINERAIEMGQCAVVDPEKQNSYNEVLGGYSSARNDRYNFFVHRHQLMKRLLAEDAAGKRA